MTSKKSNAYWVFVVILVLLATSQSFMDRQVLSITIITIRDELHISDIQYGFINAAFLVSYAIMFALSGILIDRYGSRIGLAFSVGFWSFASLLHGIANSALQFSFYRFLLGIGEGGAFPGAVKSVVEWVPVRRHAFAIGIAIGGAALGAVVAPPLIVYLMRHMGWREIFYICGVSGFIWVAVWLPATRKKYLLRSQKENNYFELDSKQTKRKFNLNYFLSNKKVRVFIIIRFVLDPIFYFFMFWIPRYLSDVHGLSLELIGKTLWIPFLALGISNIFGGWVSDLIYIKTNNLNLARKSIMGIAAFLTLPVLLIGFINSYMAIYGILTLAFFAHGLWITNYITAISDIFKKSEVSTIVGLSGSAGAISGILINPLIGYIVSTYSYSSLWFYAGIMYPVSFLFLLIIIPKIEYSK